MISVKTIGWFVCGFAAATIVVALAGAVPARAQSQGGFEPLTQDGNRLLTRPRPVPRTTGEGAGGEGAQDGTREAGGLLRSTVMPERVFDQPGNERPERRARAPSRPAATPEPTAKSSEKATTTPADGQEDGIFAGPDFGQPVADGVFNEAEPEERKDGDDPVRSDGRSGRDANVFLTPEEIGERTLRLLLVEPLGDRLVDRLFRFEPYERVGYSVGSFIAFPEIELGMLWHSNVLRAPDPRGDIALTAAPALEMLSNWNTHAFAVRGAGNFSAYNDLDSENDRAYQIEARGRLDVTRRTNVEALAGRSETQELRSTIDAGQGGGQRSTITTDRMVAAFNTRFNRLSVQLRGGVEDLSFGATIDQAGLPDLNRDRNTTRHSMAVRATWEFKPTLYAFSEAGGDKRSFEAASDNDGIFRDSTGRYVKAGLGFGNSDQRLRGEIGIGYRHQDIGDTRLEDVGGVLLDADIAWRMSALTTVRFRTLSEFVDTTLAGSGGALSRRAEIGVRHTLRRYLIGTAGVGYGWQTYEGQDLSESTITALLGLEYYVSREIALYTRYQHTRFDSDAANRDFDDDSIAVGMRIRR